ncbi:MAG: hypothetical protein F4X45_01965 [Chloroflexi bacterium]|nr:hypothetical protein [Chloroflexota bacterium]
MVAEVLANLDPIVRIHECRYVGMGSIFFRDFQLLHRRLGINDMVTVEGQWAAESRIKFNMPLACIDLMMDTAGAALAKLRLEERPHVIWLDYESRLNRSVLSDIEESIGRCAAGSVVLASINVDRVSGEERDKWLSEFGDVRDRPDPSDPRGRKEYALLSYRLLRESIQDAVRSRNAALPRGRRVEFRQILHLIYSDGSQMLTVGGAIVGNSGIGKWQQCGIESLEFTREGEESYSVSIPALTRREARYLLSRVPGSDGALTEAAERIGIPEKDAKQFASIYRFAPLFVEAEDW